MGQEEVSVMRKSFDGNCNLFFNENLEMDIQISRKEIIMKSNGKKRIFALLMCTMMIISSMCVGAAYASRTIGDIPREQSLCELYLSSSKGQAFTTPNTPSMSVATSIQVLSSTDNSVYADSGTFVATVTKSNLISAYSAHQGGPYYTSLAV